jgi:electron transport complex protein RnfD
MRQVLYALIPGALALVWAFGWGVIWNVVLATATAVLSEAVMLHLRGRAIRRFLADYSAAVTGVLIGLALPPLAPWWLPVVGTGFAMVFAKHIYGGLGYNPFNPAMVAYVVLLVSFPRLMTQWSAPVSIADARLGPWASLVFTFTRELPAGVGIDAVTGATPLDAVRTGLRRAQTLPEIRSAPIFTAVGGKGWLTANLAFLAGGVYLLARRIIGWRIPLGVLAGVAAPAAGHWVFDPTTHPGMLFHLASGATMIGAFFIATDPVSAATTPAGRLYYGAGIGLLTWIIRTYGGYPDAIAFSVLLMNMTTPLLDYYTQPRVYGHNRDRDAS